MALASADINWRVSGYRKLDKRTVVGHAIDYSSTTRYSALFAVWPLDDPSDRSIRGRPFFAVTEGPNA